jgi:hypothetical protein
MAREARGGAAELVLGRRALAWCAAPGARAESIELAHPDPGSAAAAAVALLAAHPARPVDLRLGAGHCQLLLLPWQAALDREERWRNLAQARLQERLGEEAQRWELRLGSDLPGQARLALAWPLALRDALEAAGLAKRLRSLRSVLLERIDALLQREPALSGACVEIDGDRAALALLVRGRVRRVRACRCGDLAALTTVLRAEWAGLGAEAAVAPDADAAALAAPTLALVASGDGGAQALARALAAAAPALGFVRVLEAGAAAAPAGGRRSWRDRLLGLRPAHIELQTSRAVIAPLGWATLACGLFALAAAAASLPPELARRERELALLERAQARLDAGTPAATGAARTGNAARDALEEGRALRSELRRPWHALFEQLEAAAAADGAAVHLVQLSVDPHFSGLQLVAEGRDLGHLMRFAQRVAGGAPLHSLALTHYEWRDAPGARVISASFQGELVETTLPAAPLALAASGSAP